MHSPIKELAKVWNALDYTNAVGSVLGELVTAKINWQPLHLTEIQQTKLKSRLGEVFGFLGSPEFGEYYRLKTSGLTSRFEPSATAARLLSKTGLATNHNSGNQETQMLRTLWDRSRGTQGTAAPSKITGISLERILAATNTTNSHWAILGGKVANGITVIHEALEPGFHYAGATNAVSSDTAQGLFFHLSFFARSSTSTNGGPMYLSLYWSEPDENWVLSRLFTDQLLNFRTLF